MDTCHGVKIHAKRNMKDGSREWMIPTFSYYAGRKNGQLQTTSNHCLATPMTQNLAAQLSAKLRSTGLQAELCELFADPETVVHDSLVDIGEEAPPPPKPPGSIAELANAIERCFQDGLTSLEILNHCCKAVLG
jgi:hypothetical protein